MSCHRVVSGHLMELLARLHSSVRDLARQIAESKTGIEGRRALMLAKDLAESGPRKDGVLRRIR
jgi:hypothetical protein